MQPEKLLPHGNIKVTILDDDIDVVSEEPSPPENTDGFEKIWVVADVYVFEKGKETEYKKKANQRDTYPNGITFEVPIPPKVLNDPYFKENDPKDKLHLIYYDKSKGKWFKFKGQKVDLNANKATVTLKKWIKDPPMGWGGG